MTAFSNWLLRLLLCLLVAGLSGREGDAGEIEKAPPALSWVTIGIVSISDVGSGPGVTFSSSFGKGSLTFRFYHVSRSASFDLLFRREGDLNSFFEFGFLFGRHVSRDWGVASFSAGIGLAVGTRDSFVLESYDCEDLDTGAVFPDEDFAAASLPLEAQLFLTPISRIGVGLSLLGNINAHESVWGLLLGVQLRG
jgi:hypothetical protein